MIEINSDTARLHPELIRFLEAKEAIAGKKVLHIDQIEDERLTPFHDSLIISRRMAGGDDFAFEYWGEENTRAYGFDLTGQSILTANFGELSSLFMSVDCQVISMKEAVYLNGVFDWLDEAHKVWFRVALPMNGPEGIERVLSYTSFVKGGGDGA